MLDFDPRARNQQHYNETEILTQVVQLAAAVPDSGLQLLWGVHPKPPDFVLEVEVENTPAMDEQVRGQIYLVGQVSVDALTQSISSELIAHIDSVTSHQHNSKLWHDLHIGRLTSSNFGQIFRTKNSPSLLSSILHRRYSTVYTP